MYDAAVVYNSGEQTAHIEPSGSVCRHVHFIASDSVYGTTPASWQPASYYVRTGWRATRWGPTIVRFDDR